MSKTYWSSIARTLVLWALIMAALAGVTLLAGSAVGVWQALAALCGALVCRVADVEELRARGKGGRR